MAGRKQNGKEVIYHILNCLWHHGRGITIPLSSPEIVEMIVADPFSERVLKVSHTINIESVVLMHTPSKIPTMHNRSAGMLTGADNPKPTGRNAAMMRMSGKRRSVDATFCPRVSLYH